LLHRTPSLSTGSAGYMPAPFSTASMRAGCPHPTSRDISGWNYATSPSSRLLFMQP